MLLNTRWLSYMVCASVLVGCGGGGGGASSTPPAVVISDPSLTVYSSFDLGSSIMTGTSAGDGVYQDCLNSTSQINLLKYQRDPISGSLYPQVFTLYGSFVMPNGAGSCSTAGVSGTINSITLVSNSNLVYGLTGLSIPAVGFKLGYKPFWSAVASQTGNVMSVQMTSAVITCTNSASQVLRLSLSTLGNVAGYIRACLE